MLPPAGVSLQCVQAGDVRLSLYEESVQKQETELEADPIDKIGARGQTIGRCTYLFPAMRNIMLERASYDRACFLSDLVRFSLIRSALGS